MSLYRIFDIAGSAMSAQSVRLNTTASNLANADSISSSVNTTYKSRQPVFAAALDDAQADQQGVGVKVLGVVESQKPLVKEYNPDHPMADKDGFIYKPNVNVVEEMTNMISASRSYQTNVQVADTAKQMLMRTLQLGQ
ncbi:flagellar basal body rod protein FlgC [Gallaecimonas pentaromativorans]|uniref:Flagellar basal-body rod protein FlgC n=1 Tax=Gallaecimonas pentaromativorans TaxID=584787 RepID=A0A3N1P782_9GAMM|nr:flagellar basal body rod protein FlgC [Gallaecimonas pentaromativorans]ROQ22620.1 flagellar basal-body rod protein FlgC [Gallaecimonas pentaromativorans]